MMFPPLAYALTLAIGLSLGMLGAGGAILLLPVLVYVAGMAPPQAVPMSMAVMSITSLTGALGYLRRGDVSLRLAVVFGSGGMAGAFTGTHFTHLVPARVLMLIFAGVLLAVGTLMLLRRNALTCSQPCLPPRCFMIAFSIGLLTGLLGVGGGFLLVPALMRFAGLQARAAAGTSLALISLNSFVGLAGQLRFVSVDWVAAGSILIFAVAGLLVGLRICSRIEVEYLKRGLAVLLVTIGLGIAIANVVGMA